MRSTQGKVVELASGAAGMEFGAVFYSVLWHSFELESMSHGCGYQEAEDTQKG